MTRASFVILHFAGAGASALGLFVALRMRVPLHVLLGWAFPLVCVGLGLGTVLGVSELVRGNTPATVWSSLRTLFSIAVAGWLAILAWAQPAERVWILITAGLVTATWHAVLAFRPVLARIPTSVRHAADVSISGLAASVVVLELVLRLAGGWTSSPLLARAGDMPEEVVDRLRRKPGEVFLGFPCNRLGHYDDEPRRRGPGEHLVVSIGDSFSLGTVPHSMNYTTVCERELGVPVQNFGIDATGPPEYLRILVEEAMPLDPDLVSISVFVGNDLSPLPDDEVRLPDGLRDWFDRDSVLLWLVPKRVARESRSAPDAGVEDVDRPAPVDVVFPWTEDPTLEPPTLSEQNFLCGELYRARQVSRLERSDLADFSAAMRAMKRAAGSVPLCVLIIPDEFQVEDDVWSAVLAASGGKALSRDRAQELLVPWFAEGGIACLDLLPVFRSVPPMADGRRHLYHLRNTHLNARGSRVAGEALAQFLAPRLEPTEGASRR